MLLMTAARRGWQQKASRAPPSTPSPQRLQAQSRQHRPPPERTRRCRSAGPAVRHDSIGIIRKDESLSLLIFINVLPTGVGWLAAMVMAFMLARCEPLLTYI